MNHKCLLRNHPDSFNINGISADYEFQKHSWVFVYFKLILTIKIGKKVPAFLSGEAIYKVELSQ